MLRAAVLVLLLANAGYYAWAQGLLRDWGIAPAEQSEPQRLEQQIHPENLRIGRPVSGDAASAPASPPPAAPSSAATPGQRGIQSRPCLRGPGAGRGGRQHGLPAGRPVRRAPVRGTAHGRRRPAPE